MRYKNALGDVPGDSCELIGYSVTRHQGSWYALRCLNEAEDFYLCQLSSLKKSPNFGGFLVLFAELSRERSARMHGWLRPCGDSLPSS